MDELTGSFVLFEPAGVIRVFDSRQIEDVSYSNIRTTTCRESGLNNALIHSLQYMWVQGVTTASVNGSMQIGHSSSSTTLS